MLNSLPKLLGVVWLSWVSIGVAVDSVPQPAWLAKVPAPQVGPFPPLAARELHYTGGWGKLPAGKVTITFSQKDGRQILHATGGTIGLARGLFLLDSDTLAECDPVTLEPMRAVLDETYSDEKRHTIQTFTPESVTRVRTTEPRQKDDGKVKVYRLPHVFDLQSSLLYLRSQPLKNGDEVVFLTYATGSPYIAKVTVLGRSEIEVRAGKFHAIEVQLSLVGIDKDLSLKSYRRARDIRAWLSDDAERNFLKISASIFVGTVFVELDK